MKKKTRVRVTHVRHAARCTAVRVKGHTDGRTTRRFPFEVTVCERCGTVSVTGLMRIVADWTWQKRRRGRRLRWTPANVTNQQKPRTW